MSEAEDDEFDNHSAMELWLHDLSVDSASRVAGALMIFIGSLLGVLLGIALISTNVGEILAGQLDGSDGCLLYTSPSPRDKRQSRMPSSA